MIPKSVITLQPAHTSWQDELKELITSIEALLELVEVTPSDMGLAFQASSRFPIRVTRAYANRIKKGNPNDPLLLQVLPCAQELTESIHFHADPVGDEAANVIPGLLHKYQGRVLLLVTSSCAIHCRYCFRREFDYESNKISRLEWERALTYIQSDCSISEVILSGGDPLMTSNKQLRWLLQELAQINHIQRFRVHSRLPIVLPSRVDDDLMDCFASLPHPLAMVVHANHAQEIDREVAACFTTLKSLPHITLFNQSVLLKGVNDSVSTLRELSEKLWQCGVTPYYLHLLDRVRGTTHFEVEEHEAGALQTALASELPGYLMPRWVRETKGHPFKLPFIPTSKKT